MKTLIFTFLLSFICFHTILIAQGKESQASATKQGPWRLSADHPRADTVFGFFTEISPNDTVFVTSDTTDFWVTATASADYDNDGDLDIAVVGYYVVYNVSVDYRFLLMRNDSLSSTGKWHFTYLNVPLDSITVGSADLAWGDVDGDGDLDLALGADGYSVIYRNDSGMLVLTDTQLPGYWEDNSQAYFNLHSISWADYDNDGDLDLLLPSGFDENNFSYKTSLMRNDGPDGNGGWIFSENDSVFAPTMHAQSAWADEDGDGDLDLLLINLDPLMEEGFIRIYRNEGNDVFNGEDILGSLSVEHGEVQWSDYDSDGDLDILVAGNVKELDGTYTPLALRIYRNDGTVYTTLEIIADPSSEGWFDLTAATWADYDSDGDVDILLAGHYNSGSEIEGRARIYLNNANTYSDSGTDLPAPHASGDRAGTFSWLDIDNDGDLDYFIAGEYFVPGGNGLVEAQMHLYKNDTPGQNFGPSAPQGINIAYLSGDSVLISWSPGTDDHTPVQALTYNLNLFSDGLPVQVPKQSPEPGNISTANEWLFKSLNPGNYSWTLATVDAAYIGSPFATGNFTIGTTSVNDNKGNSLSGKLMLQNYPNPFSSSTTVRFSVPEDCIVSLQVYNLSGQEVKFIMDEYFSKGTHEITIDASDLPDGIYTCRLNAGQFSLSKKMIVSR